MQEYGLFKYHSSAGICQNSASTTECQWKYLCTGHNGENRNMAIVYTWLGKDCQLPGFCHFILNMSTLVRNVKYPDTDCCSEYECVNSITLACRVL